MPEVHYVPKGCMDVYIGSVCVGGHKDVGGGGFSRNCLICFFVTITSLSLLDFPSVSVQWSIAIIEIFVQLTMCCRLFIVHVASVTTQSGVCKLVNFVVERRS